MNLGEGIDLFQWSKVYTYFTKYACIMLAQAHYVFIISAYLMQAYLYVYHETWILVVGEEQ